MNASEAELAPVLKANFMQPMIQATGSNLVVDTGRKRILVDTGFGEPVHRSAIDSTITYVKRAKEIHAASADAKTYSENLKAAFPNRQQAGWVDFSARLLYAAPR